MQGTWPKVVIVIIAVLVILFVAGVGIGATRKTGSTIDTNTLPHFGLLDPQPLATADIGFATPQDCIGSNAIVVLHKSCALLIKNQSSFLPTVRRLSIPQQPNGTLHITFEPTSSQQGTKDRLNVTLNVPGTDGKPQIDVYKEGGTLTINCDSIAPCQIPLK